ncbi:MAG: tRNA (adenosine(37)-N6)-dimethylallyltransferase MiaA [Rhodospirillaceae bacterium]|nr:tRNA (adenosine(37)-N6)-dimethylallyltransferase MiaA [Rhodospirillaceae bacterium]MBT5245224.1 tRNA (adenosine(37)-N6)-dimethylallyltransferase MiaA [Rhodospirillaceae bacterium]MBT5561950.1 tRNA (adenosine(37)-N6)-dimethylallyltransferase MiaA [Rhodospirillaceae bacterium]MBT6241932.1 tRNA (adenosine(37)-N6)-dimethylallyltransferase MiaA [Rhodospirillaceae bacterium]MBT7137839.1 tRNA (adenosine(37)-N6)-dimethylallyltransferase MiaA [Rhodospirillaceae bacterium]
MQQRVIIIAGPTASGKSALAIDLAREFSGVIINADSMQVYRELDVLSARPPASDLKQAPHRLYGVLAADDPCSVGRWLTMAVDEIKAAWADEKVPLVVGGTGLYLKALMEGLAPIPDVDPSFRAKATALHGQLGPAAFRDALAALDPEAAARIPAGDTQRLIRAYEVALATGRPLSDWQKDHPAEAPLDAAFAVIVLSPDREILYQGVNQRFAWMMDNGALDEVRALDDLSLDPALPAMKAVGVPELRRYLAGQTDLETAAHDAKQATRQFAKRQMTWLRNQLSADLPLFAQYSESLKPEIFSFIRQFMLTPPS